MSLLKGVVVATHPEDHSVDLVLVNNGARLVGVQVCAGACSSRSGTVDLPAVPEKKDKWDITKATDQEIYAVVDYIGRTPIVTGFLYPQINQMLFKDPKMRFSRHQSDVISYIDGDGNMGILHPGGAYIQIGESPDKPELAAKNADANLAADRNTGRKVHLRVALAGNSVELTMTPSGEVTLKLDSDFSMEAGGNIAMKAGGDVTIEAGGSFGVVASGDASINGANVRLNQ